MSRWNPENPQKPRYFLNLIPSALIATLTWNKMLLLTVASCWQFLDVWCVYFLGVGGVWICLIMSDLWQLLLISPPAHFKSNFQSIATGGLSTKWGKVLGDGGWVSQKYGMPWRFWRIHLGVFLRRINPPITSQWNGLNILYWSEIETTSWRSTKMCLARNLGGICIHCSLLFQGDD